MRARCPPNPLSFTRPTGDALDARSPGVVIAVAIVIIVTDAPPRRFMYYNKPNGMAHFLKNADPPVSEAVVALVDPDMVLMSPLTPYVGEGGEARGGAVP